MRITLHGGFGEKGRTSLGVASDGYAVLLDAGVKTSAPGRPDYHPALTREQLSAYDAIVVTHGHEDHVAALGWCLANGFRGRILMTAPTRRDTDESLAGYASPDERARVRGARIEELPVSGAIALGPLALETGRSGHIPGGVWCVLADARVRFGYCGDVVPASPVFAMDALARCDALALDASYGDDDVATAARAAEIAAWVARHPQGCVLPTPLYGRSAELLAVVPGALALALAPGMRAALAEQIADGTWLAPGAAALLAGRLDAASDWQEGDHLPRAALLCHDAMGLAGPAKGVLARARAEDHPVLFTGHVPEGSPGAQLLAEERASWIRLPTHPTRSENVALARASGATLLLGHSCDPPALARLKTHLPGLRADLVTGATLDL